MGEVVGVVAGVGEAGSEVVVVGDGEGGGAALLAAGVASGEQEAEESAARSARRSERMLVDGFVSSCQRILIVIGCGFSVADSAVTG